MRISRTSNSPRRRKSWRHPLESAWFDVSGSTVNLVKRDEGFYAEFQDAVVKVLEEDGSLSFDFKGEKWSCQLDCDQASQNELYWTIKGKKTFGKGLTSETVRNATWFR